MREAAVLLLVLFTVIASFDGLWLHLVRYRLHTRPASRFEHQLHTANAVLFPFTLAPLFLADASGAWLWFAVATNAAVLAIEVVDVFIEPASRADLGGLSGGESLLHFLMSGLRWAYVALAFAMVPVSRWTGPTELAWRDPFSSVFSLVPWAIAIVGLPIAAIHLTLAMPSPRFRPSPA